MIVTITAAGLRIKVFDVFQFNSTEICFKNGSLKVEISKFGY